jgi:DNA invertase Pin-like site-specific DNA recombinase
LYIRVSTLDQNPETQALDLRRLAEQGGLEIVHEYTDPISGATAKRPALNQIMAAAHKREFDTGAAMVGLTVWLVACGTFWKFSIR